MIADIKASATQHFVAAFVAVVIVAPIVWMLADRVPPYVRVSGSISPEVPQPGDFVEITWQFRVNRFCPPASRTNVTRSIIDSAGKIHDYANVDGHFGTDFGAPKTVTRGFQLPKDIAIGPAKYKSTACYACNPTQYLWPICITQPDIPFKIGGTATRHKTSE